MLIHMYYRLRQRDEEGQALVEYALILGLVAVVAIGALTLLGTNVTAVLSQIANAIPGA
jgi:pilus assembly protein Flp/PilA